MSVWQKRLPVLWFLEICLRRQNHGQNCAVCAEHNRIETQTAVVLVVVAYFGRNMELLGKDWLYGWGEKLLVGVKGRVSMRLFKHLTFWINSNALKSPKSAFFCIWEIIKKIPYQRRSSSLKASVCLDWYQSTIAVVIHLAWASGCTLIPAS